MDAAGDTPFKERVVAHGAVFSNPVDSGRAAFPSRAVGAVFFEIGSTCGRRVGAWSALQSCRQPACGPL